MGRLTEYTSNPPELLPAGDNRVRLASYKIIDSFHNYDGSEKAVLPDYVTSTEQLVITVVLAKGRGALTHRFNMDGYTKYDELTPREKESGKFIAINGYACAKDPETGKIVRLSDERKMATCISLLDNFFNAVQLPVGSSVNDLDEVITEKTEFIAHVVMDEYQKKIRPKIVSFKKAPVLVATTNDSDEEELDDDLKA